MGQGLIYVAGAPDRYPLEYYDPDTGTYQGLIPELLRRFSRESGYEIQYYEPGRADQRPGLAERQQVDLISGRAGESFPHTLGALLPVLTAETEEGPVTYGLWCSDVAPQALRAELSAFLSGVSQEVRTGLLLESAEQPPVSGRTVVTAAAGLGLAFVLLLAILLLVIRRLRRKLRHYERSRDLDEETGLGNLTWLRRQYAGTLKGGVRVLYTLYYFHLDMERLERLNGHETARAVLRRAAAVLLEYTADTDLLARVSEGGLVLLKASGPEGEGAWLNAALKRIRTLPEAAEGMEAAAAAGSCALKDGDWDLDELLLQTGMCARAACDAGEDLRVCSTSEEQRLREERSFQADMKRGLERGEFLLYLQFYVNASTGQVVGAEALTRWNHPERGFLTPDRFIPLMEREGFIEQLDQNTLTRACGFLEELWQAGIRDFFLSCNFSRRSLAAPDFVDQCRAVLARFQFPREFLVFEMTESVPSGDDAQVLQTMAGLKALGVRIALDDFGEGFTSFYDLQEYPVDSLKLDKSLIDNLGTSKGNAILKAMIRVSQELGLTILAEGVEQDDQVQALRSMGCDIIQGYRFAYPVPDWDARDQLLGRQARQGAGEGALT